jgi:predicted RNA polymerase sigma factor
VSRPGAHARRDGLERIAALYDALAQIAPSPVVELNRAVALALAFGPETGLVQVEELASEPALRGYHLLPAVRGDLLARLDRHDEARVEFERAAQLTQNARETCCLSGRRRPRSTPGLSSDVRGHVDDVVGASGNGDGDAADVREMAA